MVYIMPVWIEYERHCHFWNMILNEIWMLRPASYIYGIYSSECTSELYETAKVAVNQNMYELSTRRDFRASTRSSWICQCARYNNDEWYVGCITKWLKVWNIFNRPVIRRYFTWSSPEKVMISCQFIMVLATAEKAILVLNWHIFFNLKKMYIEVHIFKNECFSSYPIHCYCLTLHCLVL